MLTIDGKRLDDPQRCYIIAEASGNHQQDYARAEALIYAAAESGADAVKFQTFTAEEMTANIPIMFGDNPIHDAWCRRMGVTHMRELFAKGGLPRSWHVPLKRVAASVGLSFLSTPFSVDAAKFLVEEVGVPALKIASGDLTFTPLLEYASSTDLPTILSTGGATLEEVHQACMLFRCMRGTRMPLLLHCVSVYPCVDGYANLAAIQTLWHHEHLPVGFSDHTLSVEIVPAIAVALGACCYEKHLRLADDTTSVDVAHSLAPDDFARMVEVIRQVPVIKGTGIKAPHPLELHDRLWARRSPGDWLRPTDEARQGRWQ